MDRSYQIEPIDGGWRLELFEDGESAGGGKGSDADYDDLVAAGEDFAGAGRQAVGL